VQVGLQIHDPTTPGSNLAKGGPSGGTYTIYHGTNDASAADIAARGIDSNRLSVPDQFHATTDPALAGQFAGIQAGQAGGQPRIVGISIPEETFLELYSHGHIVINTALPDSLIFDQDAQRVINSLPRN